jgi:hypothetical protein
VTCSSVLAEMCLVRIQRRVRLSIIIFISMRDTHPQRSIRSLRESWSTKYRTPSHLWRTTNSIPERRETTAMIRKFTQFLLTLLFAVAAPLLLFAADPTVQPGSDAVLLGFQDPPTAAKPRVWWHWMNGNITKEGIKLDLEWMHRVGIGGFQNFDAALNTPKLVDKRLVYMTPEWKDAFLFTTKLADQLGLEEAIAGSPGWSESGGPWVKPSQAMKKFVWSETVIEGGGRFTGTLPKPPHRNWPVSGYPLCGLSSAPERRKICASP